MKQFEHPDFEMMFDGVKIESAGMLRKAVRVHGKICALLCLLAINALVCSAQTTLPKSTTRRTNQVGRSPAAASTASIIQQPQIVRIEPIAPLHLAADKSPWWSYWVPTVGPLISGLLAFLGAWQGLRIAQQNTLRTVEVSQATSAAAVWQKANEMELRDIQEKLDKFYGPFTIRLKTDHQFAQDIRSRQPDGYRLLVKLFDKDWRSALSAGDRALVEMICEHARILEEMIAVHSGSVDPELIEYFSRASAHFRILRLAYEDKLGNDYKPFTAYTYPRQLDGVLEIVMQRLRDRVAQLRANPGVPPAPMKPLEIPTNLRLPDWPDPDHRIKPQLDAEEGTG